jgi:hypothetical protein
MKTEYLKRLKAICEKEGFKLKDKRIEVEFDETTSGMVGNYSHHSIQYTFNIKRTEKKYLNPLEAGKFLASQLEKYLNNEL